MPRIVITGASDGMAPKWRASWRTPMKTGCS